MFLTVVVIGNGCWDWLKGSAKRKGHKEIGVARLGRRRGIRWE